MVTKRVTLSIDSVETTGMGFLATATARIDRYAFGITARPRGWPPGTSPWAWSPSPSRSDRAAGRRRQATPSDR
jgi:hypothetical protein